MIKWISTPFILFIFVTFSHSQEWLFLQQNGASLEEIKIAMDEKFAGKSTIKGADNYSSAYKKYARWEYFWRYQIDAAGDFVSPRQVLSSWEEAQALNNRYKRSATVSNWSLIGPSIIPTATAPAYAGMGRLNTIAFHPTNVNTFWVGAANGGLWKTTDGGATWAPAGGNLPVLGISDIAISATGDTLYIATGDADGGHSTSVGVLKSIDGGNTFAATGFTNAATDNASAMFQIHHLWVHPTNPNIVVATTTADTRRTTNGGDTWIQVDNFPSNDLKMDPNDPTTLYAGSLDAVIQSTDGGASWPNVMTTLAGAQKIDIGVTAANSMVIYAISDNGVGSKSTDGGATWNPMTMPAGFDSQGGYNMAIIVSPTNADSVMLAGVSGWVSSNGGTSWTQQLNGVWTMVGDPGKYVHSDHHMLKYMPGSSKIIFSVHDGGVHKGDFHDINATWTDLSSGLEITQFYGMGGYPPNENILIGGAQDNDGHFYNGTTFKNINNNSDGTGGVINFNNAAISYCKSQSGILNRTIDSWANATGVEPPGGGADFVWPLEMDPTTPTTLYAGYADIWKTTNQGDNWTNLTNDAAGSFTWISVAPTNSDTIYAIRQSNTIRRSVDGGMNWTTVTAPNGGTALITSIEASLTKAATVYLTYGNYDTGAKVYMSTNAGDNWTNISTGIPNIPVFTVAEKAGSGDLYVGTQLGVYERPAMAANWTAFNTNLPPVSVRALDINEIGSSLRAATFGRGIWKTPLSAGGCPSASTHVWTGATNSSWNEATNWSTGCVPTNANVVQIPNVTNDPIVTNGVTGNASSVTIMAGGHLTVQTGGTLSTAALSFTVDPAAELTVENGGFLNVPN